MSLTLTPRQNAMLAEMGIRHWARPAQATPRTATSAAAAEPPATVRRPVATKVPAAPTLPSPVASPVREATRADPATAVQRSDAPALRMRPEGVHVMDWAALQTAVADCRACGLCSGRTQTVFGVGHRQADWMVVGEAPGENEDRQGQPFVGQAGKLLDAMLAALGLSRQAGATGDETSSAASHAPQASSDNPNNASARHGVYIANVLKCRPPGNRNPQPDEVAQCEPYLRRQVALVQPKIILAMGRFAVQSLLQTTEPIGRLRGRVHHYEGVPVIVTYHPAYLLRALPEKAKAWADLCLALETMRQNGPQEIKAESAPAEAGGFAQPAEH